MKYILLFIIFSFSISIHAQGIDFFEGSWHEAIQLAKKENKPIFVDAYTLWCHPCMKLKKEIFPQKQAGDFYNGKFINLSINLESWRGLVFSLYYTVNAYPTLLFLDPDGNIIRKDIGFKNIQRMLKTGEIALEKYKNSDYPVIERENFHSKKIQKLYKKLKKAEKKQNYDKYEKYATKFYKLLSSDSLKREFIKSIYSKKIGKITTDNICYNLATDLYNQNNTKQNNILLIKILVLTKHEEEAYRNVKNALKQADDTGDVRTRIELRRYKKYLVRRAKNKRTY